MTMTAQKQTAAIPWGNLGRMVAALAVAFAGATAAFRLIHDGFHPLAGMVIALTVFLTLVLLRPSLKPWRWLATGLVLAVLFTVFPLIYTVYLSFTNMGSGHLLTREQAVQVLQKETWMAPDAPWFTWQAYQDPQGSWMLLLTDEAGASYTVVPGEKRQAFDLEAGAELPAIIGDYRALDPVEALTAIQEISNTRFGQEPEVITVDGLEAAVVTQPRYSLEADGSLRDNETGTAYRAIKGTFTADDGTELIPGFMEWNGIENYTRFLGNPGYRRPLVEIIIWNIAFSLFSVGLSFAVGMVIAVIFEQVPGKRIIRSLLIIPYPIPVLVSIMVWRALLNENMGLVTSFIRVFAGDAPDFFTDIAWARFAVILINIYLSYPYFYVLSSGALKSIPSDLYEAAAIDGASPFQSFRHITMPMVLRILMPLLIASFSFNFNNFTIIWGFNAGLPAMADTIVPMGHTDLLVSFIYRLGFSTAGVADYGFSAAITVLLFIFVGAMILGQTLRTKTIKEAA